MAPKKKGKNKSTHNEFYYFMQDQKHVLKVENIYWNDMDELVAICHPRWNMLGDAEKAKYKERAKEGKKQERECLETKFDSRGRSLASVENEKISRETHLNQMVKRIKSLLSEAHDLGKLKHQNFFLMHINILCSVNDDEKFLPCEIALLQFNLQDGIIDTFHTFIKPPNEAIPLGYGYEISKNADDTHGITLDDDPMYHPYSENWKGMASSIMKRINPGGVREAVWPIYTLADNEEMVFAVLNDLLTWGGLTIEQDFKVYHVHQLFYHLSQFLPKSEVCKSELLASDCIASDIYSYTVGMACPYHDKIDKSRFCSMNCVKRWAFLIMDKMCPQLGIDREPDTHRHVERPAWQQQKPKYKEQFFVNLDPILDDEPIKVTAEADKDLFGAPKTRAAPAGFCDVDLSKTVPNPKKMSKREREELERKHLAKTGQALDDWIKVEKSLPPTQAQCPWDKKSSDISYVPPTVTNAKSNNNTNTGNNQAWKPLRKPNPPPGWGGSPQPAEPVKSPWGAPARTDAPAPWEAPASPGGVSAPWEAPAPAKTDLHVGPAKPVESPWGAPAKTYAPAPWGAPSPTAKAPASPWGAQAAPKNKLTTGEEEFPTLGSAKPLKF